LKATASVTSYVDADNIFPLFRLQGSTIPAIVVQLVNTTPQDTHDEAFDAFIHEVEITTIGEDPKFVWRASQQVRQKMNNYANVSGRLSGGRFLNQATDIFEATDVFSVTQRYSIMELQA